MPPISQCPCSSGKAYTECCQPYHKGRLPEKALALMRSRYSAYAKQLADYIMETTHPQSPHFQTDRFAWSWQILQFSQHTSFNKLEILEFIDGEKEAFVTFAAHLSQGGKDASFVEKSRFQKVNGKWLYFKAELVKSQETQGT